MLVRNSRMAAPTQLCICCWLGESRGKTRSFPSSCQTSWGSSISSAAWAKCVCCSLVQCTGSPAGHEHHSESGTWLQQETGMRSRLWWALVGSWCFLLSSAFLKDGWPWISRHVQAASFPGQGGVYISTIHPWNCSQWSQNFHQTLIDRGCLFPSNRDHHLKVFTFSRYSSYLTI